MALSPGTRIGPYEILAPIGAGGRGEVYKATDLKLGGDVAIKVLPDDFSRDKERLARFEREAKLLAALNHTNIATLYGLEESEIGTIHTPKIALKRFIPFARMRLRGLSNSCRRLSALRDLGP
jgi:serine/threonine protein kinase